MAERYREKEFFTISVVSRMFNLHPQTLRIYEREGLVRPHRSPGNTRLYTRDNVERIEIITNLTKNLGVNLAGVDIILRMRQEMEEMRRHMEQMLRLLPEDVKAEFFGLLQAEPAREEEPEAGEET